MDNEIITFFTRQYKHDYATIVACLNELPEDAVWADVPEGVSVGNLVCHTCEMERFWIDWGLCQQPFDRNRNIEFERRGEFDIGQFIEMIETRNARTLSALDTLSPDNWESEREFHGDTFTGQGILLWHSNHVALHRGHIQAHCRWLSSTID